MERRIFQYALGLLVGAAVLVSCPSAVSRGGSGVIKVRLGGPSSRGILDAPAFPIFATATVTVTGPGMTSVTASLVNGSASLNVPAGDGRVVTVDAVPDWAATVAANPTAVPVTHATRYGGSATVDVKSGQTADLSMNLAVTGTQIVLLSVGSGAFYFAPSFSEVAGATNDFGESDLGVESDFELDQYGRLYLSDWDPTYLYSIVMRYDGGGSGNPIVTEILTTEGIPMTRIALDGVKGRLYYVGYYDDNLEHGSPVGYHDGATGQHVYFDQPANLPGEWDIYQSGLAFRPSIAVDAKGEVIMPLFDRGPDVENIGDESYYLVKATTGTPYYSADEEGYIADTTITLSVTYANALLNDDSGNPLVIYDMISLADTVYILLGDVDHDARTRSRGKIVALRSGNLSNPRSTGWSSSVFPSSPQTQFYGPARFIGMAQGKLYVADDGYSSSTTNANRVVEVTLDPLSITAVSAVPSDVTFFHEYHP